MGIARPGGSPTRVTMLATDVIPAWIGGDSAKQTLIPGSVLRTFVLNAALGQVADVAALTAPTVTHTAVTGSTNGVLVDCTAVYSEAAVEENFKELAVAYNALLADVTAMRTQVNALLDLLQAAGLVTP